MNGLGLALLGQRKYQDAESMHRRTLKLRKQILGDNNSDTIDGMVNFAIVLSLLFR
ncbi:hypothetical protein F5Y11DRAFT_339914 [Daldinia sp. FL1419]|nr:hypothetical protein F5Y11DRAFT_339914 [Daldinia sp. FL1419]